MRRLLIGLPVALLILLLGVSLALWFATRSTQGSAWLLQQGGTFVPGEIRLSNIDGNLAEGVSIGQLQYQLDDLQVEAEQLRLRIKWQSLLQGELQLRTLAAQRVKILQPPGTDETSSGSLPKLSLPIRLAVDRLDIASLELAIAGLEETLEGVSGAARWSGSQLEVQHLAAATRGLHAELMGRLRFAEAWPLDISLRWQIPATDYSGSGSLRGDLQRLEIDQQLLLPQPVMLKGSLEQPLEALSFDLLARWSQLEIPIDAARTAELSAGEAGLRGGLQDYRISLKTQARVTDAPGVSLRVAARGDLQALDVTQLNLESGVGQLSGSGRVVFEDLVVDADLVATALDPAWLLADWPGALNFGLVGRWSASGDFRLALSELQGRLRGYPVRGSLLASRSGEKLEVERGRLSVGANRLEFDLSWSPEISASFSVDAPELETLWPGLRGELSGRGKFGGDLNQPTGAAQLSGRRISLNGQALDALQLQADVDAQENIQLVFGLDGLRSGEVSLGDLQLNIDGRIAAHRAALSLTNGPVDVSLDSEGGWSEQRLLQNILRGAVENPQAGRWSLDQPFALSIAANEISAGAHCWRNEPASLCLQEFFSAAEAQRASAQLTRLPLSLFKVLAGEGFEILGSADAFIEFRRSAGELALDAQWQQADTRIRFQSGQGEALETGIDALRLNVQANEKQAEIRGSLSADYGVSAEFGGTVLAPLAGNPQLDLYLRADVPDLGLPAPLINRYLPLERLAGRADADLQLLGSLQMPRLEGSARLLDGRAFVPLAGIDLRGVELNLSSGGEQSLALLSGSADSGDGQLVLQGFVDRDVDTGLYLQFELAGENFEALRFPGQTIAVSPTISARIDQQLVNVSGQLRVPKARVEIKELPATAQTPSGDIVVHYEVPPESPRLRRSALDVIGSLEVVLGDDVALQAFGLDTRLAGNLRLLRASVKDPFRAEGALRTVGGRFTAARRELNIERGVLIFSGPVDEPRVDVRATREVTWQGREYTAGLLLTGLITEIESQVFGRPAMSDTDALSFLVLGRPASDLSGSANSELSGSAVALGLVGLLPVTSQLEESLKLDEISFTSDGSDDASIVAGKRINDEIFVRYAYGLFDRVGTFLVRYEVGRGFSLEAGSGREQSLEIIYSIDR